MQRKERASQHVGGADTTGRRQLLAQAAAGLGAAALGSAPALGAAADGGGPAGAGGKRPGTTVLRSLLDRNHGMSPQYGPGFSNHVSMGLYSLLALGGSDAALARFAEPHWVRLEPVPAAETVAFTPESWTTRLGRAEAFASYRAFFAAELLRLGRERALRAYLPGLMPGVGAAAFHALIRTAYGVRFADEREIADGLAYWATAFLPLGPLATAGQEREPRALLQAMSEDATLTGASMPNGPIHARMKAVAQLTAFGSLASALLVDRHTLPRIAAAALDLYLASGDFTALHAVTGTHAYRVLSPFLEADAVRHHFQAVAAAFVSIGAPRLATPPSSAAPPWHEIVTHALRSVDEHDLKLVEVARQEEAFYRNPLYRRAAAQRMRLV